ncbi:MAG: hypothetical protein LBE20_01505 [Deltaproteobacteria bacterium]|jgi:hypothetical protein|nr:hypothetical protein [Deltaproteobacteria bacterium]
MENKTNDLGIKYPSNSQIASRAIILVVAFIIIVIAISYYNWFFAEDNIVDELDTISGKSFDDLDKELKKYTN